LFSFVKAKPITKESALLLEEIKEAVENLKLAKQGKLKAKPLNELLNELIFIRLCVNTRFSCNFEFN